jgi:ribosome-binding ATPase YchF (GTP1/OBG family)
LDIVSGRIERLHDQIKRPRPNRDELQKELDALQPLHDLLEEGRSLHGLELTPEQERVIRAFQLFSDKPRLVIVNAADDDTQLDRFQTGSSEATPVLAIPLRLQLELSETNPEERDAFCQEMGVTVFDRDALLRQIMTASGQMLFFTAGDKEVRTWMIHRGGTAVEAAAGIHTDLARGFIRAEVMTCDDLIRLGSEREIKAHNLLRKEHKDYVIQEGEILLIQHSS